MLRQDRGKIQGIIFGVLFILAIHVLPATQSFAHEVRPGYLELRETLPGQFDVTWKLPLRGDLKPSLSPSFPAHCTQTSESRLELLPGSVIERWSIDCGLEGLDGYVIEILGLQYTLMDVALHMEMLDGRVYDALIKGSAPRYTVEAGPGHIKIIWQFMIKGTRHTPGRMEIWILLAAASLVLGYRRLLKTALLFFAAYGISFVLGVRGWIGMAPGWGVTAISLVVLSIVLRYRKDNAPQREALWSYVSFSIAGFFLGAAFATDWNTAGLSSIDKTIALSSYMVGVWIGVLLLCSILAVMRRIIRDYREKFTGWTAQIPTYVIGAAGAYLLFSSFDTLFSPGLTTPFIRPETMLAALALGYIAGQRTELQSGMLVGVFVSALTGGIVIAVFRLNLTLATTMIPVLLALLGIAVAMAIKIPLYATLVIVLLNGVYLGWVSGNWLIEHMGTVHASAVGIVFLSSMLAYFTLNLRKKRLSTGHGIIDPIAGIGILVIAVLMRLAGYRASSFGEVNARGTSAGLSIPLISLLLCIGVIVALVITLKRFRLKERRFRPALFAVAFLVLSLALYPYGRVILAKPFVSQREMSEEQSSALITKLLENTYRAINLQDEYEVYDKLALSVHSSLMEKLYLESRKRTVLPTQDNPEVQIIEVQVAEIIDISRTEDRQGYALTCEWYVSGTVRHWAHQHNRQNRYVGLITVKIEDNVWKIYGLELLDEKRVSCRFVTSEATG